MDGRNCRSPQGVWEPFQQTWESNRSVRMENVGETDVVNPWLSNGANDFYNLDAIVARAIEPGMSERDKALSLWWQEVQHRFHFGGDSVVPPGFDPNPRRVWAATVAADPVPDSPEHRRAICRGRDHRPARCRRPFRPPPGGIPLR